MKKLALKFIMAWTLFGLASQTIAQTTDSTGLPGDHFSLEGALELLKNAENLEAFERALNSENNFVHNLDLNGDGDIDYLRVIDHSENEAHAIVLQAVVSSDESQDIAVIEIEKTNENEAILQIIGDEDLYGEEIIIEPFEEEATGKGGPWERYEAVRVVVNVWLWPSIRYIYRPGYVLWVSPWRWMFYPNWWGPWRVRPFHRLALARPHYHLHYQPVHIHRVGRAHHIYAPRRTSSVTVHKHYHDRVSHYRTERGIVNTKKTTVVQGPRGGKTIIQREQTTATKKNPGGSGAKVQRTETKVVRRNAEGERTTAKRNSTRAGGKAPDGTRVGVSKSTTKATRKTSGGTSRGKQTSTKAVKKTPRRH